ncbi:FAD-dependent oxidoreductase [Microbacterium sp. LWO12-1.2]|uniref:FAD-dependent oxidoreductase n=1 Tax=Microbacterium sp. LWO12-1.2 TaxID=3135261 RepID=UPI0034199FBE
MNHEPPHEILVVGAGMVAHRFVESLLRRGGTGVRVTVVGDEDRAPYDRAGLTGLFSGATADDLTLDPSVFADERVELVPNDRVLRIDRSARSVTTRSRRRIDYDTLILATGSYAARAAVDGARLPGCFVYRTWDDLESLREFVPQRSKELGRSLRGAVIGGGWLGLGAAEALQGMDVDTLVVEDSDRLMPAELDTAAGGMLLPHLEARGIAFRTESQIAHLDPDESGAVTAMDFEDGSFRRVDVVVFAMGVHPRDELARNAGLEVHPGGGVIIDDRCATSDPRILAIGEVANFRDRIAGLVAPGHAMAEVVADRILGGDARLSGHDHSVNLTLSGVEVASFGDALARTPHAVEVTCTDADTGVYRKLVLSDDAQMLLGGILIGDASAYEALRPLVGTRLGADPSAYLETPGAGGDSGGAIARCEHFDMSHDQLLDSVRLAALTTFSAIFDHFGVGGSCEICTREVARILTVLAVPRQSGTVALTPSDPVMSEMHEGISLLARVPGGDVTPDGLIAVGLIAKEFALRTKIIAAQGIGMIGVHREQLPLIRARLLEAGFVAERSSLSSPHGFAEHGPLRPAIVKEGDADSAPIAGRVRQASR